MNKSYQQRICLLLVSSTISLMSLFKHLIKKNASQAKPLEPLSLKPYASFPESVLSLGSLSSLQAQAPQFCNTISLKTLDNNLWLQFSFLNTKSQHTESTHLPSNSAVVLSSDTAKQLFCALAELFECEILPKP
jgi:hypothetical protein